MKTNNPIDCCVNLRGKSMYYRPDERPGRLHESDVMNYYCSRTQSPVGPDGTEARPRMCQPGRNCFHCD